MMSRGWATLGVALFVGGVLIRAPGLLLVGSLAAMTGLVSEVWSRYGLRRLHYERRLAHDRAVWGDEIGLEVTVWNDKPLPLAWLAADDYASDGVVLRDHPLPRSERPGKQVFRNVWSVAWFERITRRFAVVAHRRGIFEFGPVKLTVADLFGRGTATEEHADRKLFIVRPRTVPVRIIGGEHAPLGSRRARRSLFEDASLFAGVRAYQPGDPIRRIHWRSTARLGSPVSKQFDPSRSREVLIALDIQTIEGPYWSLHFDEELHESLMVAAGSLVRHIIADGASCGFIAAGYTARRERVAYLPARGSQDQLSLVADMLGRMSETPSAPFDSILATLPYRISPGGTVMVLSGRDPTPFLLPLRRLVGLGYPCELVAMGSSAPSWAARARYAGLPAVVATLAPDWRSSDALVLAG